MNELPGIRLRLSAYRVSDIFNAYEFGLCYKLPTTTTIGPGGLSGRKKRKERVTFYASCNSDGTERLQPLIIGHSQQPRCFNGRNIAEEGYNYRAGPKAWMNRNLFFEWILSLDSYIGQTDWRKIALVIGNASCHGTSETLPALKKHRSEFSAETNQFENSATRCRHNCFYKERIAKTTALASMELY